MIYIFYIYVNTKINNHKVVPKNAFIIWSCGQVHVSSLRRFSAFHKNMGWRPLILLQNYLETYLQNALSCPVNKRKIDVFAFKMLKSIRPTSPPLNLSTVLCPIHQRMSATDTHGTHPKQGHFEFLRIVYTSQWGQRLDTLRHLKSLLFP